jgi:peptide/nickel transport system ATP-binding protein
VTLLRATGLTVSLQTPQGALPVLRRIDIALEQGKVLGLVGESGAGKSMIGRAIAQLMPPGFSVTSGALSFDGRDLVAMSSRDRRALLGREIAFIPQEPLTALNPVLTIGAQLFEHLARLGVPRARRRERAAAALEAVHLASPLALLSRYPHQLSGGMCQRALIAMAFAGAPRLVIADEPTTALDVTIQARIMGLMAELQREHGTAVLFITHDLRLAAQICDDVTVLYAGAIVEHGEARAVLHGAAHPYTRCLELATPTLRGERSALYALPEQMPGLRAMAELPGCRFTPRCPIAAERCVVAEPTMPDRAHGAACFRAELTPAIEPPAEEPRAARSNDGVLLQVLSMTKQFRDGTVAVRDVSFAIAPGEFVAVVGESGSGKTTLGRLVVGLDQCSAGRITLDGVDVTDGRDAARRHRVATVQMVFQDPQSALNPHRRVGGIVTQAMEADHAAQADRTRRTGELLAEMGLAPELATRRPAQLSGGQRQRVNIARALCRLPKLLVADEIVSGLDVSVQAQLLSLLRRLRVQHDFALLFISHDLSVVRHLCDRVLVMRGGEIVEQGEVEAVFGRPSHDYTKTLLASAPA